MSLASRLEANRTKILVLDIERLPGLARAWDQKTRFIHINNFVRLPSMLCFAAKWYGEDEMMFHASWDDHEAMIEAAWDLYHRADIVVGYNSRRFDNKHLKSEWLTAELGPPAPWKDVDLFTVNASTFGFESKSLQHLCQRLGLAGKSGHYDADMAEACMNGDTEAQATMRIYNEGDVSITEAAYVKMLPWISNHPHVAEMPADDPEAKNCNKCGSDDIARDGTYLAQQIRYVRYQCRNCGGWIRGAHHSRAAKVSGIR